MSWSLEPGVAYLNHGSFGPTPLPVQQVREEWQRRLAREPVDFFLRKMEGELDHAAHRLGELVGAPGRDLAFMDNATAAMNVVAASVPLGPGDEVLFTDHEYGAVRRIWQRACERAGARIVVAPLPCPLRDVGETVDALFAHAGPPTRLIVVSHLTSPTATILPVAEICRRARERGIPVCIDGPHAVASLPLHLRQLDCDFYCASCHKWLSAPLGSGFLYVHPRWQAKLEPVVVSWGGSVAGRGANWKDEFTWSGTRDPSAYLAVPAAIDYLAAYGWDRFRTQLHDRARAIRARLTALTGLEPLVPDSPAWYGPMALVPLPASGPHEPAGLTSPANGKRDPLQDLLWDRHRIEVPIVWWQSRRMIRVSTYLYNTDEHVDRLVNALAEHFAAG